MNNYNVVDIIGEGAYGMVLKARRKDTHNMVAIKKFKETDDDELIKKTTVREINVLRSLKHKNIVELHEAFKKKGLVHLVFEYLDNNLLEVLERNPKGLSNKLVARYTYQVLEGLEYMHSLHYVHRDIKPENLLVSAEELLKICDMGFAKSLSPEMTDYVATRWYRPPELLVGAKYGTPIDIWAVGCIMAELSDTNPLFPGNDEMDQLFQIMKCLGDLPDNIQACFQANPAYKNLLLPKVGKIEPNFNRYKAKLGEKGVDLLKKILVLDPNKRITASEALKHSYFDIVRNKKPEFLKTSDAWCSRNLSKVSLTENHTDRNARNSDIKNYENYKSAEKENISLESPINTFFKFGIKNIPNDTRVDNKQIALVEKGTNKIYRKKESEKSKYLIPYQISNRKHEKIASVGHKTNINFKISHKKRDKSSFLFNY